MILVEVKNKSSLQITNRATFKTQQEADAWIVECESVKAFGIKSEYDIIINPEYVDQTQVNEEALAFLASTDWLVIRQHETGIPVPADVLENRRLARNKVVRS